MTKTLLRFSLTQNVTVIFNVFDNPIRTLNYFN